MAHVRAPLKILVAALLALPLTTAAAQGSGQFGGLTYQVPAGWTSRTEAGALVLSPSGLATGDVVTVRFLPPAKAPADFAAWFATHVTNNSRDLAGQRTSPVQPEKTDEGDRALTQVVIGTVNGQPRFRYFLAVLHGNQVFAAHYTTSSLALLEKYQPGLEAFLNSVDPASPSGTQAKAPTPPAQGTTRPATPTPSTGGTWPSVTAISTPKFVASGRDPEVEPIPDEFRCYAELRGSDYAKPPLRLQILEGRQYRVGDGTKVFGSGAYTTVKGTLNKVRWTSGPLAGTDDAYLGFDDYGQSINLQNVGPEDKQIDFECYQRGPREDYARLTFGLRTPKPGRYACVQINANGKAAPPLELLPGNRYRVNGAEGQYRLDLLSDQDDDNGDVDFVSGPWAEKSGYYGEENGRRTLYVSRTAECSVTVKPTPIPRYGKTKAPAPPKGSGGLSGAYASWQADVGGYCGGLCWNFYIFDKNGYVYTDEPDEGLEDADCSRTHPNGLPVCEVYSFRNGQLRIGNGKPEPLRKKPDGSYDLGGTTLLAIRPVTGLKLNGTYRSFSASVAVGGLSSSYSEAFLRFTPDGRFSRESSGGASSTFTDTGTSSGSVTGGVTATSSRSSSGTYRFVGNTLELKYADGHVVRSFAFLPDSEGGKPSTGLVRIGGRSYTLQDGK